MADLFEHRQRIVWGYWHHLGRNKTWREKHGIFGVMKLEKRYVTHGPYQRSTTLAKVYFDGNRGHSIVPVSELRAE